MKALTALERRLQRRLRGEPPRRRPSSGYDWDGQYGNGAGRTHASVEFVACPVCRSLPGVLCTGPHGPKLSTHYRRRYAYRDLVAALKAKRV